MKKPIVQLTLFEVLVSESIGDAQVPLIKEAADVPESIEPEPADELDPFYDDNKGWRLLGVCSWADIPRPPERGHLIAVTWTCRRIIRGGHCSSLSLRVTMDEIDPTIDYQHWWGNTWQPVESWPCPTCSRKIVVGLLKLVGLSVPADLIPPRIF